MRRAATHWELVDLLFLLFFCPKVPYYWILAPAPLWHIDVQYRTVCPLTPLSLPRAAVHGPLQNWEWETIRILMFTLWQDPDQSWSVLPRLQLWTRPSISGEYSNLLKYPHFSLLGTILEMSSKSWQFSEKNYVSMSVVLKHFHVKDPQQYM